MANIMFKVEVILHEDKETFIHRFLPGDDFNAFKENLLERYRILETTSFKMVWIDTDKDVIRVINAEDFLLFIELNAEKMYVVLDSLWAQFYAPFLKKNDCKPSNVVSPSLSGRPVNIIIPKNASDKNNLLDSEGNKEDNLSNTYQVQYASTRIKQSIGDGKNVPEINGGLNDGKDTEDNQFYIRNEQDFLEDFKNSGKLKGAKIYAVKKTTWDKWEDSNKNQDDNLSNKSQVPNASTTVKQSIGDIKKVLGINDGLNVGKAPDGNLSPEQHALVRDLLAKSKEKLRRLTTEHRDLHGSVSKVGKTIDRNFTADLSSTMKTDVLLEERNIQLLNKVIAQHFYRQGMDDVADTLVQEAELPKEDFSREPFAELHSIWECIQNKNIQPALEWTSRYSKELMAKNSTLEFKLHRLAYMQILVQGVNAQSEALKYARTHFAKFVSIFQKDIQILMGALMYLPVGIENSPYRTLIAPEMWIEAADTFLKDACQTLGIIKDSPLSIVTNAGCAALPALLNIKQVMISRQVPGIWSGRDELPIEIDLDPENRYHSIFACPILRQQSSEDNPPMKLTCGHVISRDALNKLSNGQLLKCPYCPMEQSPADAKLIYFQ